MCSFTYVLSTTSHKLLIPVNRQFLVVYSANMYLIKYSNGDAHANMYKNLQPQQLSSPEETFFVCRDLVGSTVTICATCRLAMFYNLR